jgi:hypothetical protein
LNLWQIMLYCKPMGGGELGGAEVVQA